MRAGYGLFAILFLVAAVVQWNDPDPLGWIAIYGVAAALAGRAAVRGIGPVLAPALVAAIALAWAAVLVPRFAGRVAPSELFAEWKMSVLGGPLEEAREATGLGLVALAMAALAVHGRLSARTAPSPGAPPPGSAGPGTTAPPRAGSPAGR